MTKYSFPNDFLWGSATSAFQVEGDCTNHDFYAWSLQGRIKDGSNPTDAVLHYQKYQTDLQLLKKLNHNAARIGLEWARIEPSEGVFDETVIAHYRDELTQMRELGLKTMVTLHHFANPLWFTAFGGWKNSQTITYFLSYVTKITASLGDLVDFWLTFNEPNTYLVEAYFLGNFPPGEKSLFSSQIVSKNFIKAHRQAYSIIKKIHQENGFIPAEIGWSVAWVHFEPASNNPLHHLGTWLANHLFLNQLLNPIKKQLDFIGLQYYRSDLIRFPFTNLPHSENTPKSKLGWDMIPEHFYLALKNCWQKYQIPIYVTENGVCDENDELRPGYLVQHLYHLWRALQDGIPIKGYFHWSTLDNFELVQGLACRFGLIHVDHESPERTRTIKPSGHLYAQIIQAGGLTDELLQQYPLVNLNATPQIHQAPNQHTNQITPHL